MFKALLQACEISVNKYKYSTTLRTVLLYISIEASSSSMDEFISLQTIFKGEKLKQYVKEYSRHTHTERNKF